MQSKHDTLNKLLFIKYNRVTTYITTNIVMDANNMISYEFGRQGKYPISYYYMVWIEVAYTL